MVIEEELQQLLQVLRPLYEEIQQRRARLHDLETVPLARDMYEQALSLENEQLSLLHKRKQSLKEERALLILAQQSGENAHSVQAMRSAKRQHAYFSLWNAPQLSSITSANRKEQERATIDRAQIQRLINRWRFVWKIDPAIIGHFNRIAANAESPIGEALTLLDWSLYQECIYPGESLAAHLERIKQWYTALTEYHTWLSAELRTQEARFQGLLQVWEIWRQRELPKDNERWPAFIERTRRAKQVEIERIIHEINEASQEIARIREESNRYE